MKTVKFVKYGNDYKEYDLTGTKCKTEEYYMLDNWEILP